MKLFCKSREDIIKARIKKLVLNLWRDNITVGEVITTQRAIGRMYKMIKK